MVVVVVHQTFCKVTAEHKSSTSGSKVAPALEVEPSNFKKHLFMPGARRLKLMRVKQVYTTASPSNQVNVLEEVEIKIVEIVETYNLKKHIFMLGARRLKQMRDTARPSNQVKEADLSCARRP